MVSSMTKHQWHQMGSSDVLAAQGSGEEGLTRAEVLKRKDEFGLNELTGKGGRNPWRILWEQLTALMMLILIAAAVVSAFLGDLKNAIAIGAIVLLNALLGFSQEYKAEQAMAALKKLAVPHARVKREGEIVEISSVDLVPGDVVFLEAGNFVPADCRVLESAHLQIQEAALTGESEAIEKKVEVIAGENAALGDRLNMVYRGTIVSAGRGRAVVTETGMRTELGKIAQLLADVEQDQTPLQKRLDELGKGLAIAAGAIVTFIFILGWLRGDELQLLFLTAVSIGVAAVPEGLPAVVTIALTLGAQRMLKRNVLIRRLGAVETLGSITVICSDKTGTLTQNRMSVEHLEWAGNETALRSGIEQKTGIDAEGWLLLLGGALCNDATTGTEELGDPTEVALAVAAGRFGLERLEIEKELPRVGELPFDSDRKRMTTVHKLRGDAGGLPSQMQGWDRVAFVKGSVEGLLSLSTSVWTGGETVSLDADWRKRIEDALEDLARNGMRVLGVAVRGLEEAIPIEAESVEKDLIFLGLVGIIDPPRKEAALAVATCQSAGIRGVMITGDHPLTAQYIAKELGLSEEDGPILIGHEIEKMSVAELRRLASETTVFARVSPEHKLKIVEALQQEGHIAAMTGDGVNDAPALKKADIGIAMGITGTDVAKEAADMVLLDDNFASIVSAVEEGRIIYDNVRKFIKYILATNAGEVSLMIAAPLLGMPLPLLPLQILWLNLVTDGLPALALGIEKPEANVMRRPPHRPDESVFARGLGVFIVWMGVLMAAVCLGTGYWYWSQGVAEWQTILFTTMVFAQMANVLALRSAEESVFRVGFFSNPALIGAVALTVVLQFALIYVPALQSFFGTQPMTWEQLGVSVLASSTLFWAVEIDKWWKRRA